MQCALLIVQGDNGWVLGTQSCPQAMRRFFIPCFRTVNKVGITVLIVWSRDYHSSSTGIGMHASLVCHPESTP